MRKVAVDVVHFSLISLQIHGGCVVLRCHRYSAHFSFSSVLLLLLIILLGLPLCDTPCRYSFGIYGSRLIRKIYPSGPNTIYGRTPHLPIYQDKPPQDDQQEAESASTIDRQDLE